ncbi:MAG: type III pantothenate kinase, partial [Rikenellaceae bacterium]
VRERDEVLMNYLKDKYIEFVEVTSSTPMPLKINYKTPETVGVDRLMAAVGARHYNSKDDLLVCDFGSAITFDFISSKGEFLGGNISPGAALRFRSLHSFTKRLPLCSLDEKVSLIGEDTNSAIVSGVVNGIIYEIKGYLDHLEGSKNSFSVFFTGGDGKYFADKLKKTIFVKSYLTIIGMYVVLNYNYANK